MQVLQANVERIKELFLKHLHEEISDAEQLELNVFLDQSETNRVLFDTFSDESKLREQLREYSKIIDDRSGWEKCMKKLNETPVKPVRWVIWKKYVTAALILLYAGLGTSIVLFHTGPKDRIAGNSIDYGKLIDEIVPSVDRATLKLADGTVIVLNQAKIGQVILQRNANFDMQVEQMSYEETPIDNQHAVVEYNTLSTKRGERYQFDLSDGTRVFLNAASELKFPASFSGDERRVELKGEAYFKVAHDRNKPFRVVVNPVANGTRGQTVEVLGTSFNIMAYEDEPFVKTTLLEGSIKIFSNSRIYKPRIILRGQQALIFNGKEGQIFVNENADTSGAVAWKEGIMVFEQTNMKRAFRQISRWYNVDVEFEPNIREQYFTAIFNRQTRLRTVLQMLNKMGDIKLKIEGRKIIVIR